MFNMANGEKCGDGAQKNYGNDGRKKEALV